MPSTAHALYISPYPDSTMIYKICTPEEWDSFQKTGIFGGNALDLRDGFIHLSHAHQVQRIAQKYFPTEPIVLLHIPLETELGDIRWEPNSTGDLFPHLYGNLKIENIRQSQEIYSQDFDFGTLPLSNNTLNQ